MITLHSKSINLKILSFSNTEAMYSFQCSILISVKSIVCIQSSILDSLFYVEIVKISCSGNMYIHTAIAYRTTEPKKKFKVKSINSMIENLLQLIKSKKEIL